MLALCPNCKVKTPVGVNLEELSKPVAVLGFLCGCTWTLTEQDMKHLRKAKAEGMV